MKQAIRFGRLGRSDAGFSLAEMLVVVGIMGTLAAIGFPKYKGFTATARQSEAKNNLSHIYTLQQTFMGDNERYGALSKIGPGAGASCSRSGAANEINFKLQPCKDGQDLDAWSTSRYNYEVSFTNSATKEDFKATATSGAGALNTVNSSCSGAETQTIDHNKSMSITNDASKC